MALTGGQNCFGFHPPSPFFRAKKLKQLKYARADWKIGKNMIFLA
jgi:hypothetical protein